MERLRELDALRGLAACGVAFFFHFATFTGSFTSDPFGGFPPARWLQGHGWTLVDLFFVLSGFVFCHVYAGRQVSAGEFFLARFARLYPLHFATLVIMAALPLAPHVVELYRPVNDGYHFALNLFMLQRVGLEASESFNVPAWSISVEVACYALIAVALAAAIPGNIARSTGEPQPLLHWWMCRGIVGFFTGCLLWQYRRAFDRVPTWALALIAANSLLIATSWPPLHDTIGRGAATALLAWPWLILLALRLPILRAAPLQWLGARSYSIYLIHMPVQFTMLAPLAGPVPASWWPAFAAAHVVFTLALADLSYRCLEKPAREALRFSARRRSA